MRNRSKMERHLVGGFVGGVLGILATTVFTSLFVAVACGCFVGVVLGFWYQELWTAVCTQYEKYKEQRLWQELWQKVLDRNSPPQPHSRAKDYLEVGSGIGLVIGLMIATAFLAILGKVVGNLTLMMFEVPGDLLAGFIGGILLVAIFTTICIAVENSKKVDTSFAFKDAYEKYGGIAVFIRALLTRTFFSIGLIATIASGSVWLSFLIVLFVVGICSVALTALLGGIGNGIFRIAVGPGHWTCVFVTTAVTGYIAYATQGVLVNQIALWAAALTAGTLSGVLSVFAHELLQQWIVRHEGIAVTLRVPALNRAKRTMRDWVTPDLEHVVGLWKKLPGLPA